MIFVEIQVNFHKLSHHQIINAFRVEQITLVTVESREKSNETNDVEKIKHHCKSRTQITILWRKVERDQRCRKDWTLKMEIKVNFPKKISTWSNQHSILYGTDHNRDYWIEENVQRDKPNVLFNRHAENHNQQHSSHHYQLPNWTLAHPSIHATLHQAGEWKI